MIGSCGKPPRGLSRELLWKLLEIEVPFPRKSANRKIYKVKKQSYLIDERREKSRKERQHFPRHSSS